MIKKTIKILVASVTGIAGYSFSNRNPHEQFKKPELKQVIAREPYRVQIFLHLPLNSLSRLWGKICQVQVPIFIRPLVYSAYIKAYKCNISEAENENLKSYSCFSDFFTRALKHDARPISESAILVSPSDGVLLSMGQVDTCSVNHVKDKDYKLQYFLGPKTWSTPHATSNWLYRLTGGWFGSKKMVEAVFEASDSHSDAKYIQNLKHKPTNHLFHCTIYLAPGDYHRFHSPAEWKCYFRRHFPGYLLSVSPRMADRMPELMNVNERVVYVGEWVHGFMSMAMVGATNVGSIKVYSDQSLETNVKGNLPCMLDVHFPDPATIHDTVDNTDAFHVKTTFHKGEAFGQFNLGSTIVLLFEAPADFKFSHRVGDHLKFGGAL